MTHFEQDIIDVHVMLENWLGKGEGDVDALLAHFQPDFMMLTPGGVHFDYNALVGSWTFSAAAVWSGNCS